MVALRDLVDALKSETEVTATQEYQEAEGIIKTVETAWKSSGSNGH